MSKLLTQYEKAYQLVFDSDIPEQILLREITISLSRSIKKREFKPVKGPLAFFLIQTLNHEVGRKEGSVILPGALKGLERNEGNVVLLTAAVFDIDGGEDIEHTRSKLEKAGWVYSLHTTHSDGKTVTTAPVSKIGVANESDISTDLLERYLSKHKLYTSAISSTIEGFKLDCDKKGTRIVQIQHGPIRKFRIVIPLEEPFASGHYRSLVEAKRAWAGYLEAVAQTLELDFDRACLDLSRAFFLPRHARGRPFEVYVGGTRLLDLAKLEPIELQAEGKRSAAAPTPARSPISLPPTESAAPRPWLRDYLRREDHRLDIVDWLINEIGWETRGRPTDVKASILCPNDGAHSNAGDLDDTACIAMSPKATNCGRAIISCQHAHCRHLRMPDFLNMILDQIETQELSA